MKSAPRFCWPWLMLSSVLLGLPGHLFAGEQTASQEILKLGPLIQEALQNNPELVAEQALVEVMVERNLQSQSLDDPEFTKTNLEAPLFERGGKVQSAGGRPRL